MQSHEARSYIFDLHSDLVTDITRRRAGGERQVFKRRHYPRLRTSGVRALVAVLWVEPEYRGNSAARLLQLLGSLLADLAESGDCVQLVSNQSSLERALAEGKIALFLGVEGMTFVEQWPIFEAQAGVGNGSMAESKSESEAGLQAEQFRQALSVLLPFGLRQAILVWGEKNALASGPGRLYRPEQGSGLTAFGRQVVQELQARDVVIDLSHLDDASIDDVLEATTGPVMASHSNARALCDVPRNLLNRHIQAIGARGGVIGVNAYADFVDPERATVDRLIDHVVYLASQIGVEHVGFGFDFTDYLPDDDFALRADAELRRVEDVPQLIRRMSERGFSEAEIEKIAFSNAVRMMTKGIVR